MFRIKFYNMNMQESLLSAWLSAPKSCSIIKEDR